MPVMAALRGGLQTDGDGDGLLVVHDQRREHRAGCELVAPRDPALGVHGVAEIAQPFDVPAQRTRADLEPVGELAPRPVAVGLQERQQLQHARARRHADENSPVQARN
jgi:hypothetical protein